MATTLLHEDHQEQQRGLERLRKWRLELGGGFAGELLMFSDSHHTPLVS